MNPSQEIKTMPVPPLDIRTLVATMLDYTILVRGGEEFRPREFATFLTQYKNAVTFFIKNKCLQELVPGAPSSELAEVWENIRPKKNFFGIVKEEFTVLSTWIVQLQSSEMFITSLGLTSTPKNKFGSFEDFLTRVEAYVETENIPEYEQHHIQKSLDSDFYGRITRAIVQRHQELRQALQQLHEGLDSL